VRVGDPPRQQRHPSRGEPVDALEGGRPLPGGFAADTVRVQGCHHIGEIVAAPHHRIEHRFDAIAGVRH
jgi:hypothetical protein